jgi:cell division protein FtsB
VKRLPLLLLGLGALLALGVLSSVVTQGFQEVARAEQERTDLEAEKARLERSIAELEATLSALRGSPAAVESMARLDLGWIRPGETVLILATPTLPPLPVSTTEATPTPVYSLQRSSRELPFPVAAPRGPHRAHCADFASRRAPPNPFRAVVKAVIGFEMGRLEIGLLHAGPRPWRRLASPESRSDDPRSVPADGRWLARLSHIVEPAVFRRLSSGPDARDGR